MQALFEMKVKGASGGARVNPDAFGTTPACPHLALRGGGRYGVRPPLRRGCADKKKPGGEAGPKAG